MAEREQPLVPIWAESKARKRLDVLKDVANVVKTIDDSDRVRANQPIAGMTEAARDLFAI